MRDEGRVMNRPGKQKKIDRRLGGIHVYIPFQS